MARFSSALYTLTFLLSIFLLSFSVDGVVCGVGMVQHVELPVPKPKKDEVLVKVEACSINPIDWKVQKGLMKPVLPYRFPHVPGELHTWD